MQVPRGREPRGQRALVVGLASAGAVAAAGFGVMNVFWRRAGVSEDLPGLYDYLSSSWGDGILLPLAAGGLTYLRATLDPARAERLVGGASAAAGALVGLGVQIAWLLDDAPELNWTLPAPHQFNGAGLYHAGFLVSMCGYASWLAATTTLRAGVPNKRSFRPDGRIALALALTSAAGFVALLIFDNQEPRAAAGAATLTATAAAAAAGVAVLVGVRLRARRRGGQAA